FSKYFDKRLEIVCATFCKLRKLKRAGECFPRTRQDSALTRKRVRAERSALAAVGRRPPPQRHTEPRRGEGGVGGTAPHAFSDYLFAELSVRCPPGNCRSQR